MKKKLSVFILVVLTGAAYWFFSLRLDYTKIALVLPSSKLAASPYYYKKDGDFFLASDLKKGFEKLGYTVEYRFREDYADLALGDIGNVLYFKGYYNFKHLPDDGNQRRKKVLYLYYVEGLEPQILAEADVVASASTKLIATFLQPNGIKAVFVPQFTNPERFKPAPYEAGKTYDVLFVGSNHTGKSRQSVNYALEAGAPLAVFGKFWGKLLTPETLRGSYIDNDELFKYYANAGVVLNDHREDMRYYGFVSNRIYDVTASGGFVLTDYLPEIEQAFGENIATYKNYDEFKEKLAYYLAHPKQRQQMAEAARQITLENFTNLKIAQMFSDVFKKIKK